LPRECILHCQAWVRAVFNVSSIEAINALNHVAATIPLLRRQRRRVPLVAEGRDGALARVVAVLGAVVATKIAAL